VPVLKGNSRAQSRRGILLASVPIRRTPREFVFQAEVVTLLPMRRIRRVTAAVTSLLMVHIGIAKGATACPLGDDASAIGETTASTVGTQAMPAEHAHDDASAKSRPGERTPAQHTHHHSHDRSHCMTPCTTAGCSALGHCSSAAMRGARGSSALFRATMGAARSHVNVPRSISTAPEPPPPRA
jgi:hypothetical protein